jgi:hypothetical protein
MQFDELVKLYLERKYPAKAPKGDSFKKDTGEPSRVDSRKSTTDNFVRTHKNPTTTHAKKFGKREEEEYDEDAEKVDKDRMKCNSPRRTSGGSKKFVVKACKDGKEKIVRFGDPNMKIKKSNPKRRKSFRARHKCDQKKDKFSAGYWSCKKW